MRKFLVLFVLLFVFCSQNEKSDQPEDTSTQGSMPSLTWKAPAGWQEETPTSAMRKAQFRLPRAEGDPEDALIVVYHFHGEGGSVQANLDRWFGQFVQPNGTPSKEVAKVTTSTKNGLKQTIADVSGTYIATMGPLASSNTEKPNYRMLAAVIETEAGPWFAKLVGPEKTVSKWEDSFYEFVNSFKKAAA